MIIFIVVDLPAPLGPRKPSTSPRATVERHVVDRQDRAEPPMQMAHVDHRVHAGPVSQGAAVLGPLFALRVIPRHVPHFARVKSSPGAGCAAKIAVMYSGIIARCGMLILTLPQGIAVGIVIALPVGPVGVLCVRRTLFEGAWFGLASGLGAALADTMFGIVAGFGLTAVRDVVLGYQDLLGAAGGLFLVVAGARALAKRDVPEPEPLAGERVLGAFASAFALTITNPITIFGLHRDLRQGRARP